MDKVIELFKNREIDKIIEFFSNNKELISLPIEELVPKVFKDIDEYKGFMRELTIAYSRAMMKKELGDDDLIGVYVRYLDLFDEIINTLFENLFEHFILFFPEASLKLQSLTTFLEIDRLDRKEIAKKLGIDEESVGIEMEDKDILLLSSTLELLRNMVKKKEEYEKRVVELVEKVAPNTSKVAGSMVAARLLAAAGGLRRLMLMPSSTIQVIGAEKAIFRHLRRKSKPPKHGIIFMSSYVSGAPSKHRGKMARALASKISIAAKVDYFKGGEIWRKLVKELDSKLEGLRKR